MSISLSSGGSLLVLPNPTYGDSQESQHALTLRRDLSGEAHTYLQRSKFTQLDITFDNLSATEVGSIKTFVAAKLLEDITYTDHYSRVYIGQIVSEPIEYVELRTGCSYTLTLNFVGVLQ